MKTTGLLGILLLGGPLAYSQADHLQVYEGGKSMFLFYQIQGQDNYYSLSRKFHTSPRLIAKINHVRFDHLLLAGEQLKIPLTRDNFLQAGIGLSKRRFQPLYHQVTPGETLYHIGLEYGGVGTGRVRKWNHLSGSRLESGSDLIVGWARFPVYQNEMSRKGIRAANTPGMQNSRSGLLAKKATDPPISPDHSFLQKKQQTGPWNALDPNPSADPSGNLSVSSPAVLSRPDAGAFAEEFDQEASGLKDLVEEKGAGGWFKSTIPPGSKDYYALQDSVARGTIIKVTNPMNGRHVFVKVLDSMPPGPPDPTILIRISDAAKKDLGISSGRYFCELTYPK